MISTIFTALGLKKWVAIAIEIVIIANIVAAAVLYVSNLRHEAADLKVLQASEARISRTYACATPIEACLAQRDALAAKAKADAEAKNAADLAAARTKLAGAIDQIQSQTTTIELLIEKDELNNDGPVPKVLTDTWAAERERRGAK